MDKQRLLVDLDVLLDTRLSAIASVNNEAAVYLMNNGYQERLSDNFEYLTNGLITNEQFKEAYLNRDKNTLKKAVVTAFPFALKNIIRNLTNLTANTPLSNEVVLGINIWPYSFSEEEKEMLKLVLYNYVGSELEYRCVFERLAPHEITPNYLKDKWEGYVSYDYDLWIRDNQQNLIDLPIPKYTLIGPAVSKLEHIDKPIVVVEEIGEIDPFQHIEMFLSPYISLELLDAKYFSIFKLV